MYRPEEVLRPNVTVGGIGGLLCPSGMSELDDRFDRLPLNDLEAIFELHCQLLSQHQIYLAKAIKSPVPKKLKDNLD
jgi:hypothetical protein